MIGRNLISMSGGVVAISAVSTCKIPAPIVIMPAFIISRMKPSVAKPEMVAIRVKRIIKSHIRVKSSIIIGIVIVIGRIIRISRRIIYQTIGRTGIIVRCVIIARMP